MYVKRGRESAHPPPSSLGKGVRGKPLVDGVDNGDTPVGEIERHGTPPWWALWTGRVNGQSLPEHESPWYSLTGAVHGVLPLSQAIGGH